MKLKIIDDENTISKVIDAKRGSLLSEVLRREGIFPETPCGGMGRCGKCRVRFESGEPKITDADRRFFSESELKDGMRLSCRAVLTSDAEIAVMGNAIETQMAETEQGRAFGSENIRDKEKSNGQKEQKAHRANSGEEDLFLAIDLGSTTIVGALISNNPDIHSFKILGKTSLMNHQRIYGADVISRIKAAGEGKAQELKELVLSDLQTFLKENIKGVYIAGNTTMLHLLTGDSCEGLGKAPYTPVRLAYPKMSLSEIFSGTKRILSGDCPVNIFPGISAFVGADIVSGMYALDFDRIPEGKKYMLIDLGTNGEMAIGDSEKIIVCSTAAGPVFEGGGISCGMPGIKGAIEHVELCIKGDGDNPETNDKSQESSENGEMIRKICIIGDKDGHKETKALGICGSGVLELVSELRRLNVIDETGLLKEEYFDTGFPLTQENNGEKDLVFTQGDIRALQLAKAAIRSGIRTLLCEAGCSAEDVDRVYLAGGFGEHLHPEKIQYIKLLPEEFLKKDVLQSPGNTSLMGCIKAIESEDKAKEHVTAIIDKSVEVKLATSEAFNESFFEDMNF